MGRVMRAVGGLAVAVALSGCGSDGPGEALASDTTSPAVAGPVSSVPTTSPPTTDPPEPDYAAIYRRLHDEAVAFVLDPLEAPSDALNCERNVGCIELANQAADGQFWQGIGPDNLVVTSIEVLDVVSPDLVHLKVAAEADDVIQLVASDGEVVEYHGVPTGAVKRVVLIRRDGDWMLSSPMDGRSWTRQAYEPVVSFGLVDPLDEPMEPTGQEGVTADGVSWRAMVTEDRFCLEAEKLSIGKVTRCLSEPQYSDLDTTINFRMVFSGDLPSQEYIVLWFGLKADEGILTLEDGQEQIDQLFPVDTSAVFDGVELSVGVSMIDQRPITIAARGPEEDGVESITLDWPVPRD